MRTSLEENNSFVLQVAESKEAESMNQYQVDIENFKLDEINC